LKTGATKQVRTAIEKLALTEKGETSPYYIGCLYAQIRDSERAFEWLEKSYAMRQADLVSIKVDPALDNVRDDPRYADLLKRVNLADH